MTLYDGETSATDLNKDNGGPSYSTWWGGQDANSLVDCTVSPHAGKVCARWTCQAAGSGGAFMADPSWVGLNIEPIQSVEFWARGEKGGESVVLEFFDRNLGKPKEGDGFFNPIALKDISTKWTKYTFNLSTLTRGREGKRPLDLRIFEGFKVSGSGQGTVIYLDDLKLVLGERPEVRYSPIKLNHLGYRPDDTKVAILNRKVEKFEIITAKTSEVVFTGKPVFVAEKDADSGDYIATADFSAVTAVGSYALRLPSGEKSVDFKVSKDVYRAAWIDMMRTYYYQRCNIALEAPWAGKFTHEKCHLGDAEAAFDTGNDGKPVTGHLDMTGGWHDAGDSNKYAWMYDILWTLADAYELFPGKFPDKQLNIPESGNGRSDLLDEWMYEVRWFLKMQVASGPEVGMAYDRLKQTDGQDGVTELQLKRTIRPPNSQSTAEYCASMALAAHVLGKEKDIECQSLAKECRSAALRAWTAYLKCSKNGTMRYPENKPVTYDLWKYKAAAEMYRMTGEEVYHKILKEDLDRYVELYRSGDIRWGQDKFQPFFVYCSMPEDKTDAATVEKMKGVVRHYRDLIGEYVAKNGYRVPMGTTEHFCWGSNGHLSNNGVIFYHLYLWDHRKEDLQTVKRVADYLLGENAVDKVMLTGWGKALIYHGVWGKTEDPDAFPPGYVPGGVNMHDGNGWMSRYPQKCYRDGITNWTMNENSIGYQAPAIFVMSVFAP
jgi:endoglucanase